MIHQFWADLQSWADLSLFTELDLTVIYRQRGSRATYSRS